MKISLFFFSRMLHLKAGIFRFLMLFENFEIAILFLRASADVNRRPSMSLIVVLELLFLSQRMA